MVADRYLRFDIRRPPGGRPLLWPVRVWKVLYPTRRILRLNLFQRAILGLARAQCKDSSEMAELLGLDRELVAFIIATQLIPNGWMTTLVAVTPEGERALEDAQEASEGLRMGYAYQDAISGNWLPRFTEELPEIEAKRIDERGYPIFLRDLNSGKEDRPFRLNHSREKAMDLGALFDAFERYQTDHDRAKQRDDELPTPIRSESLSFVEESAQQMWLWTWVFPDEAGPQPWLISDPFGLQQAASWLRKPLQQVLSRNDGAARYIADAIGDTRTNDLSPEEWLRSLENQIDLTLLADYSWSRKLPLIEGYLASVLRRRALLAGQDKSWQEDVTSLLIESHNLAESVLQWLLKAYPPDIRRLPHWKDRRDWKDGEAQYYLQFFDLSCLTEDVIKRLAEQRLDQVRSAAKRGSSSLKALLFAALLATVDQVEHPFLKLPADALRLSRMLDMADARNKKAGHSGGERIDREDAMEYADFVIEWVQIFKDWY
ncbi:hypothetical protein G5B35_09145 [Parapusillimonas sp. SGNA-6]|nr:hypothetical protein [Parapusillimonas sp. SGNA-6]